VAEEKSFATNLMETPPSNQGHQDNKPFQVIPYADASSSKDI
jgi:hypothetical protein